MASERSTIEKATIIAQALGQNPIVRSVIAVLFFAILFFGFDFPWFILLPLAAVIYWLIGWVSAKDVVPDVDHGQLMREHYAETTHRSFALAKQVRSHPNTRDLALKVATSSQAILQAADSTEKLQLAAHYFRSLEELYLPNLEMFTVNEQRLDDGVVRQFETVILPKLVERAQDLEKDMYKDEHFAFTSRSELLALDLGMLPGLDFAAAASPEEGTSHEK